MTNEKIVIMSAEKTTGKQLYRMINRIISERSQRIKQPLSKVDFIKVSGLSRQQLDNYRRGTDKPSGDGLLKIAKGLEAWGIEYKIEV